MQTRKVFFKTLGALVAVAMLMAMLPAGEVMAQATITVCASGCDYTSIQAAIDDVATSAGDTINVAAGTYAETLTIDKQVTLQGPNSEINPNTGTRVGEAVIVYPTGVTENTDLVSVTANGVTVAGFTIDGKDLEATLWGEGIYSEANNLTVKNNIVKNFRQIGIRTGANNGGPYFTGALIENNKVTSDVSGIYFSYSGIYLQGTQGVVRGNVVDSASRGIQIQPYTNPETTQGVVEDNSFTAYTSPLYFNYSDNVNSNWVFRKNVLTGIPSLTDSSFFEYFAGITVETFYSGNVLFEENQVYTGTANAANIYQYYERGTVMDGTRSATPNWWGSAGGPATGQINGSVDYSPWCGDAVCSFLMEEISLDAEYYNSGDTVAVTVADVNKNLDPVRIDKVNFDAKSDSDSVGITITLMENGVNTGVFTGSFPTTGTIPPGADELLVDDGDTITVSPTNNDNPTYTATAKVDDTAPVTVIVSPLKDAITNNAMPEIKATYSDSDGGSGINTDSVVMTLDGAVVDGGVEALEVTYMPTTDLSEGLHTVTVDVSDKVGNPAETASWSFTVDTVHPTVVIGLDPEPPYTAEGTITFTLTFSEDMDTTVAPSVTFGLVGTEHTVDGGWSEESLTEWVGTFVIDESWVIGDDGEQTLKVSGAKDKARNLMETDTSTEFTIDLNAPNAPTLSAPADAAIIEDTSTPKFEWDAVIDASGVTYQLQLDDNDDFSSPVLDVSDIEETSYTTEGLDNALYSWRVRAIDGAGNEGEWSEVRTFTLNADTEDPIVTLLSPNGGEVWNGGSEQTISWTAGDNITDDENIEFTLELLRGGVFDTTIAEDVTVADENLELVDGVFSYTWTIPGYNNNYYRIKITATDLQGNTATDTSDNDFTIVPLITSEIDLLAGWNLFSLPLIPNDTSIEVLLADLVASDSVAQVVAWPYDVDLGRIVEMRWNGVQLTDITDLEDGPGYWIQMTKPGVLEFDGVPVVGPGQAPHAYDVYAGWNLIGFKSQQTTMDAETYLGADVSASMRMMYEYDADTGFYSQVALETKLKPGSGYWLALSTNGTIYPPAS